MGSTVPGMTEIGTDWRVVGGVTTAWFDAPSLIEGAALAGRGAVMLDGKMEDDASLKQCLVMVALAEQLAAIDPALKEQYDAIEVPADE